MDWDKISAILSGNWPFFAVALILGVTGEVIKGIVLGEDNKAVQNSTFARVFKKTLPLHPIIAGALLGLILSATIPDIISTGGIVSSVLYFSLSGTVSSTLYSISKNLKPELTKALRRKIAAISGGSKQEQSD